MHQILTDIKLKTFFPYVQIPIKCNQQQPGSSLCNVKKIGLVIFTLIYILYAVRQSSMRTETHSYIQILFYLFIGRLHVRFSHPVNKSTEIWPMRANKINIIVSFNENHGRACN
jgi:hypothetical protein